MPEGGLGHATWAEHMAQVIQFRRSFQKQAGMDLLPDSQIPGSLVA